MRKFSLKSPILFPTNVRIIQKSTSGEIIDVQEAKNMVLKSYGLYSWIYLLTGSFHNGSNISEDIYIPKYLAIGSNTPPSNGAPNVDTAVRITDTSLYHELTDNTDGVTPARIKLNRLNFIEDNESGHYLKLQYEAYVPEDRYVNAQIGEFALMTAESGFNAFARISGFDVFEKKPNTVIQVIWELSIISVEQSDRWLPINKTPLKEAIAKGIDILQKYTTDPKDDTGATIEGARVALNNLLEPASVAKTGLWYLTEDNEYVTQDAINNYLSKDYVSLTDTGLIPLINKWEDWSPPSNGNK